MKLPFGWTLLFVGCLLVQCTSARSIPDEKEAERNDLNSSYIPSVARTVNATDWAKVRRERGEPVEEPVLDPMLPQYPFLTSIKHLARSNSTNSTNTTAASTDLAIPYDFDTQHLPCDLDSGGRESVVWAFPNHCVWAYNNKYNDEKSYRIYKIYQLEGFFFGQYYERLKRFEMDPRVWDYAKTGVS